MTLNYRNKTIFDWHDFENNLISSKISLAIMNFMKSVIDDDNIKNVIIRDVSTDVGIILQIKENSKYNFYSKISSFLTQLGYNISYFGIQLPKNNVFIKGQNITIIKNNFIKFQVNYISPIIISLLPDSFYQPNISILPIYYENFKKWIIDSKSNKMINLGDDGGNICTILNSIFSDMISLFHCNKSYECAQEMIKDNVIENLKITYDINDCYSFDKNNENIIVFINPGRKGLRDYEIDFINKGLNIKNIIYMACNYKAFERDLQKLKKLNIIDNIELNVMPNTNKRQNLIYLKV